jgi:hypothetical protein
LAFKLQSAVEFILTYLWAILLIAGVIIVLLYVGIFNLNGLSPKAPAGACKVVRPFGPGTTQQANLVGDCFGQIPQFVLTSRGIGDFVNIPNSNNPHNPLNITGNVTITAWVYIHGQPFHDIVDKEYQYGMKIDVNNQPHPCTPSDNTGFCLEWDTACEWNGRGYPIQGAAYNKWMFIATTISGQLKSWYANGNYLGDYVTGCTMGYSNANTVIGAISPNWLGTGYGMEEWFNGSIADVQIYNASLSANEIRSIYLEGIVGPPIDLRHIVGWWPLDGNANDYSGNNETGGIFNQSFYGDTSWQNSYQPP